MSVRWLKKNVPGFEALSKAELTAIKDFSLLWSLFESRVFPEGADARRIAEVVDQWQREGTLDPGSFDRQVTYFRKRYFENGRFTRHYEFLNLRARDHIPLVRAVLDGTNDDPRDRTLAVLMIIYRFRNNLFHGMKWEYLLQGQLTNFRQSNMALRALLEQHGALPGL